MGAGLTLCGGGAGLLRVGLLPQSGGLEWSHQSPLSGNFSVGGTLGHTG